MATPEKLIIEHDASDFFRQEVADAKKQLGIRLDSMCEFYLVQLLSQQMHQSYESTAQHNEPLFVMRQRAQSQPPHERMALLKHMGDEALYTSGFFAESIERSLVDMTYYAAMGEGAYRDLSALVGVGHHGETLQALYGQLAEDFVVLVDVLNQVASHAQQQSHDDRFVLQLYERYTRTKNQRVKKMLEGRGLVVLDSLTDGSGH